MRPETTLIRWPKQEGQLGYRPAFDGMRAAAVLGVVAFHAGTRLAGGWIGVDIFFVLSGFLITTLLLEEWARHGSITLRAFYGRRARRLLPALFLTIAAVGVVYAIYPDVSRGRGYGWTALAVVFYVGNVARIDLGLLFHTWSLALEEQFYVIWPAALILCLRLRLRVRSVFLVAVAGAAAFSLARAAFWMFNRDAFSMNWRADGLLLGSAAAIVWSTQRGRDALGRVAGRPAIAGAAVVFLLLYAVRAHPADRSSFYGGLTLVAVAAALIILHVLVAPRSPLSRLLSLPPMVWVGKRSYGIYLFHPIAFAVVNEHTTSLWPRAFLGLTLTLLAAAASFRFVESPFLRRKRYHQEMTPASVPAVAA